MLREIYINNFILIDEIRLEFDHGLNVLTGETGTGKSIVVDALELLFGEKISADLVRSNAEKSVVEGILELPPDSESSAFLAEKEIEMEDGLLIIRREIGKNGRVVNRINGVTVTASLLKSLSETLIDIHLQHDSQQILNPSVHMQILDQFDPALQNLVGTVGDSYRTLAAVIREIEELAKLNQKRTQETEFLEFQIKEIEQAAVQPGEEEELQQEKQRMMNAEKLGAALDKLQRLLYGGQSAAFDQVAAAVTIARELNDPELNQLAVQLDEVYYTLEDAGLKLGRFADELEFEPGRLDVVEDRLTEIHRIKKKYGDSLPEITGFLEQARIRLDDLNAAEVRLEEMETDKARLLDHYNQLADDLTEARTAAGFTLQTQVLEHLAALAMPGVRFQIEVRPATPGPRGKDEVVFQFSANPGEPLRPLARIASGGEMSRFVLALKAAVAQIYPVETFVFDEIDVGVGGQALLSMGEKIWEISRSRQVILVTHSPQIAAMADHHLALFKEIGQDTTNVTVTRLNDFGRVRELSRMLAGDQVTDAAVEHARQMLRQAFDRRVTHSHDSIEAETHG